MLDPALFPPPPTGTPTVGEGQDVRVMETSLGTMAFELYPEDVPGP